MADLTKGVVKPLPRAHFVDMVAGEALNIGDLVYVSGENTVSKADTSTAAKATALGVVVSCKNGKDALAGETVGVQYFGRIAGFSGAAPGALLYVSDTPGEISDTAPAAASGKYKAVIGIYAGEDHVILLPIDEPVQM